MPRPGPHDHVILLATEQAELVADLERALARGGIPYQLGLLPGPPPRTVFSVPRARLNEAREHIAILLSEDEDELPRSDEPAAFPWRPLIPVLLVIGLHMLVVFLMWSPLLDLGTVLSSGGIRRGSTLDEPWRLITAMFLHSSPSHVVWNGLSMVVFAVPLLVELLPARTWTIYFAAGIAGGLSALYFGDAGTVTIGSSGAVAGLFGAWVAHRLKRTRFAAPTWRARVRVLGIGLLVLPSLLTPTSASGQTISVASHVGGLAAGLVLGFVFSRDRSRDSGESE